MSDEADDDVTAIETDPEPRAFDSGQLGAPDKPTITRGRTYSETTRQAFKVAALKMKAQQDDGADSEDLEPAIQTDDKPPAAAQARTPESPGTPPVMPAAAAPTSPVASAVDAIAAERMAQLDAREKKLTEREAQQRDYLGRFKEDPEDTVRSMIREAHGLDSDDAVKPYAVDLVTGLSGQVLGLEVPQDVRARSERKKAERLIKEHNAQLAKREEATTAKEKAVLAAEERRGVVGNIRTELTKNADKFPWLLASNEDGDPADIVYGVADAIITKDPTWKPSLDDAADRANKFYEKKARASYEKYKHLLNPAPQKPAVTAATSQQERLPGSKARETLMNEQQASTSSQPSNSGRPLTNEDRRRASMKRFRASIPVDE